jgi:hypothetical protein
VLDFIGTPESFSHSYRRGLQRRLAHASFKAVVNWAGADEARLRAVARARHYRIGWVFWRLKAARDATDDALRKAIGEF